MKVFVFFLFIFIVLIVCSRKKDISFVMHRDVIRWRTWFLVPLPNIGEANIRSEISSYAHHSCALYFEGIFYCRGNDKTVAMFELAWQDYKVSCVKSVE